MIIHLIFSQVQEISTCFLSPSLSVKLAHITSIVWLPPSKTPSYTTKSLVLNYSFLYLFNFFHFKNQVSFYVYLTRSCDTVWWISYATILSFESYQSSDNFLQFYSLIFPDLDNFDIYLFLRRGAAKNVPYVRGQMGNWNSSSVCPWNTRTKKRIWRQLQKNLV
jgi:hypothetical protein